jgi:F0F1-type ATP synthase assembly protein I
MNKTKKLKYGKIIEGAEQLSLGISVVVAILLGVAMGLWMKNTFNQAWLLWLGVFWGIGGAILNVKKAYDKQKRELDKIKDDPKYSYKRDLDDDEDEY